MDLSFVKKRMILLKPKHSIPLMWTEKLKVMKTHALIFTNINYKKG